MTGSHRGRREDDKGTKLEIKPKTRCPSFHSICVYGRDFVYDVRASGYECVESSSYVLWHAIEPVSRG